ncbi:MAG: serine hydrolase, partial [Gammaproteobacteria bacterium]
MSNRPWMSFFLFSLLSCYIQFTNATEIVPAESVGMSSSALLDATSRLQQHIDDGELAGVVAAVARDGKLVYFESLGKLNIGTGKSMQDDALFRIYS